MGLVPRQSLRDFQDDGVERVCRGLNDRPPLFPLTPAQAGVWGGLEIAWRDPRLREDERVLSGVGFRQHF